MNRSLEALGVDYGKHDLSSNGNGDLICDAVDLYLMHCEFILSIESHELMDISR